MDCKQGRSGKGKKRSASSGDGRGSGSAPSILSTLRCSWAAYVRAGVPIMGLTIIRT